MIDTQEVLKLFSSIRNQSPEVSLEPQLSTERFLWTFKISGVDTLGLLLSQLKLEARKPPVASMAKQAELIQKKLTYLDEGFKLLEHDSDQQRLFLRGSSPQQKGDKSYYFEIVLTGGTALTLDHYEFDRTAGQRRLSPANLSSETFERLVEDLQNILD